MRIAVVGGGIAGLTAAHALRRGRPGADVILFEGSPRLGGKVALGELAGMTIDVGAEAILARRPEATDLARDVGLGDLIVHPETITAGIWTRGAVREIPPSVMGVPADIDALEACGIVDPATVSALRELVSPPPGVDEDLSVAAYVEQRLGPPGREIVDRLIEPLLGGVYAGLTSRLSLRAAAPQIAALDPELLAGAAAAREKVDPSPVFAGISGGVGRLPERVAASSGADIRLGSTVRQITRDGDGWMLVVGPTDDVQRVRVDAVVVATPGPAAARLLSGAVPDAAFLLSGIDYASTALVSLALPLDGFVAPVAGSGFLVPAVDGRAIKAATVSSNKWGWVGEAAPPDTMIVRCSLGRAGESAALQRSDDELVRLAVADLGEAIGFRGAPMDTHVQRWGGGLPQYDVGHLDRVDAIERGVADVRGLEVCGAAYRGVGIPAVIASAQGAAERLLADLGD